VKVGEGRKVPETGQAARACTHRGAAAWGASCGAWRGCALDLCGWCRRAAEMGCEVVGVAGSCGVGGRLAVGEGGPVAKDLAARA